MTETAAQVEFSMPETFQGNRTGPVRWILSHALHHWPILLMSLISASGNAGFYSVTPILIGRAFNIITSPNPDLSKLFNIALWIAGSQLARGGLQFFRNFGFELMAQRVERDVRREMYVNLLGKSMTFHSMQAVGDTMARATNDVREVNFLFSPGVNLVAGSIIFIFMPIILAPNYHPSLVLTPILFAVLYFFALRNYLRRLKPVTDEVRSSFGVLNTRLSESLDGIETVKGAAQEVSEVNRFGTNAQRYRDAAVQQGDIEARYIPLLLLYLALGLGLLHGLWLLNRGVLSTGDVVGYFGLLLMLDFPTFISLFAYSQISLGVAGARRILELMNQETNLDQNLTGYQNEMRGEVEFRQVAFSYQEGDEIFSEISFKVKPGQTVAIVGQTGTGKTTLTKLINRTYDALEGQVLVDGVDVRDWNLEALRQSVSIIEQDIFLFSQSIAQNIAFGKSDASLEEIQTAAKAAQADDFIKTFAEGYDTVVGERGTTLSGGQRQRLALARAFLTDPKILILDDSTSAIDSATEDKIQRAIFTAAQGRTTFIITHRLSQIRWADLILVMRKGKLSACGTHEDLLRTSKDYRRIFAE